MPPHAGGLELVVQNLVDGLRERNNDVRWLASADPLPPGTNGHLIRVPAFKRMEDLLHVPLPFWGPSGYAQLASQVRWADVVHAHDCLYPCSAAALLLARRYSKPFVLTQHIASVPYGMPLDLVQAVAYRTLGRAVIEGASRVVAYSEHVPPYFRALGMRQPIQIVPLGFDARFQPSVRARALELRRKFGVPSDGPIVLFVGRLVPKKGVADVVAAQRELARRGYTLVVAGDGALAPLIDGVPGVVHLRSIKYAEMHELYGMGDVLFLPSRGEGLPLTLQEALLCGLPAVVSQDPSYTENVANAPGVALREGGPNWVQAIVDAIERPVAAAEIAAWAASHFGRGPFLDGYERVYRELLGAQSAHG